MDSLHENYFKYNHTQQEMYKENYLLTSGVNPQVTDYRYNNVDCKKFVIALGFTVHVNVRYVVETRYDTKPEKWQTKLVTFDSLYDTDRFNLYYNYSGNDLGATYSKEETTFKVWAPTSSRVLLYLYDSGTPSTFDDGSDDVRGIDMVFQKGGVWQLTVKGNLNKQYYTYFLVNSNGNVEAADPYAKACGINGQRSMVLDFSTTNPTNWSNVPEVWDGKGGYDISCPNDLTVYESHIRDLTIDKSWAMKRYVSPSSSCRSSNILMTCA